MKRFKCSLRMCFPHKVWVKEWQRFLSENHSNIKCKEKYTVDGVKLPVTYIYDDKVEHRCYVCDTPRPDALEVRGWTAWHICVDGGLIRYGKTNYMDDVTCPKGRCDSIVFDRRDLWFVEFKVNTTSVLDKQLWSDLSDGMKQIKGFVKNLRQKMDRKRTPLNKYFSITHQHCTVCMIKYPSMSIQRNNELERFRKEVGIKLQQLTVIPK
mgnify:CR=1 FL=1